jgi:hypothetical protein
MWSEMACHQPEKWSFLACENSRPDALTKIEGQLAQAKVHFYAPGGLFYRRLHQHRNPGGQSPGKGVCGLSPERS